MSTLSFTSHFCSPRAPPVKASDAREVVCTIRERQPAVAPCPPRRPVCGVVDTQALLSLTDKHAPTVRTSAAHSSAPCIPAAADEMTSAASSSAPWLPPAAALEVAAEAVDPWIPTAAALVSTEPTRMPSVRYRYKNASKTTIAVEQYRRRAMPPLADNEHTEFYF
jgi:hypothetical protein